MYSLQAIYFIIEKQNIQNIRCRFSSAFFFTFPLTKKKNDSQAAILLFFRIVSLSCSPTGGAFVCSAAASKKSLMAPLRLSQSKLSEMSSMLSSSSPSSSAGVLQCWDMKAMRVEVQYAWLQQLLSAEQSSASSASINRALVRILSTVLF